jgi:hypothetical protein
MRAEDPKPAFTSVAGFRRAAAAVSSGTEPGDELDLDGDAERQLGEANR